MTQDEFEKLRARLEEQLRLDVEMLYEAHRVKLRAFETIRQARAELEGSERPPVATVSTVSNLEPRPPELADEEAQPAPVAPAVKTRGEAWSVFDEIVYVLGKLPDEFDKYDVVRAIGQTPSKATLARALEALCKENILAISTPGFGRYPARFRKLPRAALLAARDAEVAKPESGAPA
jgi:hypothetical protein